MRPEDSLLSQYRYEPDLRRATTLPSSWYTEPAMFALESERVFARKDVRLPTDIDLRSVAAGPARFGCRSRVLLHLSSTRKSTSPSQAPSRWKSLPCFTARETSNAFLGAENDSLGRLR